jgi:hypothetical protein
VAFFVERVGWISHLFLVSYRKRVSLRAISFAYSLRPNTFVLRELNKATHRAALFDCGNTFLKFLDDLVSQFGVVRADDYA